MIQLPSTSRILKIGVGIAIVIVLNLFFIFSIQLVYNEPQYEDFCPQEQVRVVPQNKEECLAVGGQWVDDKFIQRGLPRPERLEPAVIEKEQEGYCNPEFTCREDFEDARATYERNVFVGLVAFGTLTLIASFVVRALAVIAPALSTGGVLALIIASVRFWSHMDEYVRVIVLGVALVALIWLGVKKFNKDQEENSQAEPPVSTS